MLLIWACTPPADTAETAWERGENPHPLDEVLRVNHVQAEGSHNSTHVEPESPVDDSHRYTHAPLATQLGELGVRQLELDLHRSEGGEWHVFHIPVVDQETTCLELTDCLRSIKDWSDEAGWHLPLMIWMEPKDDLDEAVDGYEAITEFDSLDRAIREVFPPSRLLTPDDVRGSHPDLPTALEEDGWPLLGEARGRVIFSLLDSGSHRDRYLAGHPVLEDRVLFVDSSSVDDPFAATFKDGSSQQIQAWVEAGFLVTTNAAGAGSTDEEALQEWDQALAAGAHFVATDLPGPVEGRAFQAQVPTGAPARCNPVSAPSECTPQAVESLD